MTCINDTRLLDRIITQSARIEISPEYYHMGTEYLTGTSRREDCPDDVIELMSTIIKAVFSTSTLAKSAGILSLEEVQGTSLYTSLMGIKKALAQSTFSEDKLQEIANKYAPVDIDKPFDFRKAYKKKLATLTHLSYCGITTSTTTSADSRLPTTITSASFLHCLVYTFHKEAAVDFTFTFATWYIFKKPYLSSIAHYSKENLTGTTTTIASYHKRRFYIFYKGIVKFYLSSVIVFFSFHYIGPTTIIVNFISIHNINKKTTLEWKVEATYTILLTLRRIHFQQGQETPEILNKLEELANIHSDIFDLSERNRNRVALLLLEESQLLQEQNQVMSTYTNNLEPYNSKMAIATFISILERAMRRDGIENEQAKVDILCLKMPPHIYEKISDFESYDEITEYLVANFDNRISKKTAQSRLRVVKINMKSLEESLREIGKLVEQANPEISDNRKSKKINISDRCKVHPKGFHTNAECRSQQNSSNNASQRRYHRNEPRSENNSLNAYSISKRNPKLVYEKVILTTISNTIPKQTNICHLEVMIDSGASHIFINNEMAEELNLQVSEKPGPLISTVKLHGKTTTIPKEDLLIIDNEIPMIFGMPGLRKLNYCIKFLDNTDGKKFPSPTINVLMGNESEITLKENLLKKYPGGFSLNKFDIGCCNLKAPLIEFHKVELGATKRYDPVPPILDELEKQIQQFVRLKIFTPSYTAKYVANNLGVHKSDGSIRLVTDFREVNQIVVKDRYVSEKVTTILRDIQQYSVCSSLDITSAYSQVRLHDLNLDTLGCRLKKHVFAYQRLPQGFCNSPSYFQRIVDNLIGTHKNVIIYQDDVLILSPDLQSHTKDVEAVISKLIQAGFKLNLSKCQFFKEECEFLGYKLCPTGICPTEKFLLRIKTYPECQSIADLRKFRGIFNYIKHLIPNSSSLMFNLNFFIGDTSKKEGRKKIAIPEQVKEDIKRMINAAAKTNGIKFIDYNKMFYLFCDGSSTGVGATLCQSYKTITTPEAHINFKDFYAVAFYSTSWKPYQRNAPSVLYEIRAISYSLTYFSEIICNCPIVILTDHKNLLSIVNTSTDYRFLKYAFNIASYNPLLVWISGSTNSTADWLSRQQPHPTTSPSQEGENKVLMHFSKIPKLQKNQKNYTKETEKLALKYFEIYHSKSIHNNIQKIWYIIKEKLLNKGFSPRETKKILSIIRRMIDRCQVCLSENSIRRKKPKSSNYTYPLEKIYTDLSTFEKVAGNPKAGQITVISIIDAFSNYLIAGTIPNTTSNTISKFFEVHLFNQFGYPKQIHSDSGKYYTEGAFAEMCKSYGIIQSFSIKYSHATNQMVERSFLTLQLAIRKHCSETNKNTWISRLPWIVYQINNSCFAEENYSPNQLIYSFPHRTILGDESNNEISNDNLKEYYAIKKEIMKLPTRKIIFSNNGKSGKLGKQNLSGTAVEILNPLSNHPTFQVLPDNTTDLRKIQKVSSQSCRVPDIFSSTTGA